MFFLPRNIGSLAKVAAKESTRYAMTGIRLEELPEGGYRAVATDSKMLAVVTERATESPVAFSRITALASAPNGATAALVPAKDLVAALKSIPKPKRWAGKDGMDRAAVVMGDDVTTLATTDGTNTAVAAPRNQAGRFPPYAAILPNGNPVAAVKLNAKRLAALLTVAAEFVRDGDDDNAVTLELHGPSKPLAIRTAGGCQEFVGLLMPIS